MAIEQVSVTQIAGVEQAYRQHSVPQGGTERLAQSGDTRGLSKTPSPKDSIQISSATVMKNLDTTRAIEEMHARLNERARGVRETNEALNQVTERTVGMQQVLQGIVKNFPPFPPESSERRDVLMSYLSIRKELERLTVPPPPPPVYEHVKHLWEQLFDTNGRLKIEAAPDVRTDESDAGVRGVLDALATTTERVALMSNLMTDALVKGF